MGGGRHLDRRAVTTNQKVGAHHGGPRSEKLLCNSQGEKRRAKMVSGVVRNGSPWARLRDAVMGLDDISVKVASPARPPDAWEASVSAHQYALGANA